MDGKTFEDLTYEVIKCISPAKISRDIIPFDSVREIVLAELRFGKRDAQDSPDSDVESKRITKLKMMPPSMKKKRRIDFEDMDEGTSSSSSSHFAHTEDGNGYGGPVSRYTSTDCKFDDVKPPRSISAKNLGNSMRLSTSSNNSSSIHHTASAPVLSSMANGNDETKKKAMTNRERRMAETRQARTKNYRGEFEVFEFNCDENALESHFEDYYWQMMNDPTVAATNMFYRIVEALDTYFRGRTWDNNCMKLSCEFLDKSVHKTCSQLTQAHDAKDTSDEMRVKEFMVQVFLGLHIFTFVAEKALLDDTVRKLRFIYLTASPQRMRIFLEEPVTDIFLDQIAESVAKIFEELCVALPADLAHFDTGFKIDAIDETVLGRRRNAHAGKIEEMLAETAAEMGNGSVERKNEPRKSIKRKIDIAKEHSSPSRKRLVLTSGEERKTEKKRFFVEETPDEKYHKIKEEISEELDEVVQQTPMAKLRMAANKNGRRCSKRLSDLVKMSEERAQIPKRARENMEKLLEKTKASTPLRSVRRTSKSFLFSNNSPSPLSVTRSSRTSLSTRFSTCSSKPSTSTSALATPLGMTVDKKNSLRSIRTSRSNGSLFQNGNSSPVESPLNGRLRLRVKRENYEEEDDDDFFEEEYQNGKDVVKKSKNGKEWTDRRLKSKLGLTRDDLNRYREAMLAAGTIKQEPTGNEVKMEEETARDHQWDNRQVNRAGRVKGSGTVKEEEEGNEPMIQKKKQQNIYICHVLLNESNPDTSFDWSKVNNLFDDLQNKPVTRSVQNLLMKPEKILESYKRKFMESSSASSSPNAKRSKSMVSSPKKVVVSPRKELPSVLNGVIRRKSKTKQSMVDSYEEDEFGFEPEAD